MTVSVLSPLQGDAAHVVVAWLLTYLLHSTLLLGGVWLATRRGRVPELLQDTLWKIALVGGLLTATVQSTAGWRPFAAVELGGAQRPSTEASPPPSAYAQGSSLAVSVPGPASALHGSSHRESLPGSRAAPGHAQGRTARDPGPGSREPAGEWLLGSLAAFWQEVLLSLWILGATASLLRYGFAGRRLRAALGERREITSGELSVLLGELCRKASVRGRVRLTCSDRIATPVALGKAEICVPPDALTRLSRDQQESMLAHELGHLVRGDPRWLVLAGALERGLFLQPLNSVGRRRLQEVSEYLCDDWAIRLTGSGLTLARCLSAVASWVAPSPRALPLAGIAESGSPLVRRIQRLLDGPSRPTAFNARSRRILVAGGALALVGVLAPGVFASARVEAGSGTGESPPAQQDRSPAGAGSTSETLAGGDTVPTADPPPSGTARDGAAGSTAPAAEAPAGEPEPVPAARQVRLCWDPAELSSVRAEAQTTGDRITVEWIGPDCTVSLRAHGLLEFTPDEADLRSLSRRGSFALEERYRGGSRSLTITAGRGGLEHTWRVDGQPRPLNAEARAWMASAIPEMIRYAGINAASRSRAILQREGPEGLLREIALLYHDEPRVTYFETLLERAELDRALWRRVLREIGVRISHDPTKADLLMKVVRRPLADHAVLPDLLAAASSIGFDASLSRVLVTVARTYPLDSSAQGEFLRAAGTIEFGPQRRDALRSLVADRKLDPELLDELLESARSIEWDPDLAGLLVQVAKTYALSGEALDAYLRAAETIQSPSYRRRVMEALPAQPRTED